MQWPHLVVAVRGDEGDAITRETIYDAWNGIRDSKGVASPVEPALTGPPSASGYPLQVRGGVSGSSPSAIRATARGTSRGESVRASSSGAVSKVSRSKESRDKRPRRAVPRGTSCRDIQRHHPYYDVFSMCGCVSRHTIETAPRLIRPWPIFARYPSIAMEMKEEDEGFEEGDVDEHRGTDMIVNDDEGDGDENLSVPCSSASQSYLKPITIRCVLRE